MSNRTIYNIIQYIFQLARFFEIYYCTMNPVNPSSVLFLTVNTNANLKISNKYYAVS